jgi:hypothetical protein
MSCIKPIDNDVIDKIKAEIAEEHGLPTEAVFVVDIKECHSENTDFYLVDVLIQDDEYYKSTYAVQVDEDDSGLLIMDWQVKEKENDKEIS